MEGDTLLGFATFEILDDRLPTDFVGTFSHTESVLFIYQFTTRTNYARADWSADTALLAAIEVRAQDLGVRELAEALDVHHPYSNTQNSDFDAFGFYTAHKFHQDHSSQLQWQAGEGKQVGCMVVRKVLLM